MEEDPGPITNWEHDRINAECTLDSLNEVRYALNAELTVSAGLIAALREIEDLALLPPITAQTKAIYEIAKAVLS